MSSNEQQPKAAPLKPEDYYFENGLMVFTAAYHRRRGYCCGSGCRHCPYGHVTGSTELAVGPIAGPEAPTD